MLPVNSYSDIGNKLALAVRHYQAGDLRLAEEHLHEYLRAEPGRAEAHHLLGIIALKTGRYDQAITSILHALSFDPHAANYYTNLGLAYEALGRVDEAAEQFQQATCIQPDLAEAHYNLGNILKLQGKLGEAIRCYLEALRLKPNLAEACINVGGSLAQQKRFEEAMAWYRHALQIRPDFAEAYNGLGHAHERQALLDHAVRHYQKAIRLNPRSAEAHHGLGCALQELDKIVEAVASYREALRLRPNFAEALTNLGIALEQQEKFDEALASYELALRVKTSYPAAHWSRALLWLLHGDFERGWPEYLRRWTQIWDGSDLAGQTILLYSEQGLGNTLQMIRYVHLVKHRRGKVIVECEPSLLCLMASVPGIDNLLAHGAALPAFDVQASLLSLPAIQRASLDTIPAPVPYVFADAKLVQKWQQELKPRQGFKVGITWQGNSAWRGSRQRYIPLAHFARLAQINGVQLTNLQKLPGTDQVLAREGRFPILDLGSHLDEASGGFMDTAAVMMNLDLVISADTAIIHLAGALGIPVWVALPLVPDWRWLLAREDSPWYPTMRLFRQTRHGRWDDVFERLAAELQALLACRPE